MSGDLAYSLGLLRRLGTDLSDLSDVLDGSAARVHHDAEDVGHRSVFDALERFADSWDDKRELLTRSLRDIGAMATESASTFEEVDEKLAAKVRQALEGEA